jgi:hypothetical protein
MHWQLWYPELVGTHTGVPEWDADGQPDALSLFRDASFSDLWEDARMVEVVQYLRANRRLRLPPAWKDAIPKSL